MTTILNGGASHGEIEVDEGWLRDSFDLIKKYGSGSAYAVQGESPKLLSDAEAAEIGERIVRGFRLDQTPIGVISAAIMGAREDHLRHCAACRVERRARETFSRFVAWFKAKIRK